MMYKKVLVTALMMTMLCVSCKKEAVGDASISGIVSSYSGPLRAAKVTLESDVSSEPMQVAVTGSNGYYAFEGLKDGNYTINAEKTECQWIWMVVDGETDHRTHKVSVSEGQDRVVDILLKEAYSVVDTALMITDFAGNPISKVVITRETSTVAFQLRNMSSYSINWQLLHGEDFLIDGYVGYQYVQYRLFSRVSHTSGALQPRQNTEVVLTVNPDIFTIERYQTYPSYQLVFSGSGNQYIDVDLDFMH